VVIREHEGDSEPWGVLTGDTLFIGDVGRPDLLASAGRSPEELARSLFRSLHGPSGRGRSRHAGDVLPPGQPIVVVTDPGREAEARLRLARIGLDAGRPTVVFCGSGHRSSVAASVLRARGFARVADVLGGFQAWEAAGLPVSVPRE
jgi:rhodanese-related sulfurtransferase